MPAAIPLAILGAGIGGSVASAAIGGSAAKSAADTQAQAAQNALDYTKQVEAPFVNLGTTSAANLMQAFQSGTFGPGSLPAYSLPTAEQAKATPGYQFTLDQGLLGINRGAAAAGGAFTGGTLKSLAGYAGGLADTTYQQTVQNSLASYQEQLAKQSQEFQQAFAPVQLGQAAAANQAANISNLMTNIGNAQAAGTVGQANAITQGIGGITNSLTSGLLLNSLLPPSPYQQGVNYINQNPLPAPTGGGTSGGLAASAGIPLPPDPGTGVG